MTQPTSRTAFKSRILQNLGEPVIRVNVADVQVENRIDEALYFWQEWHYDATERSLVSIRISADDVKNKYVTIPEEVIGINRVVHIGASTGITNNLLSVNYQMRAAILDVFASQGSMSIIPYYMAMQHVSFLDLILSPQPTIEFNRHVDKLYIQTNWSKFVVGEYIVIDARKVINSAQMWSDIWLQRYATALVDYQWGENMSKWTGAQMPGGVVINGDARKSAAKEEIEKLETMLKRDLVEPLGIFVG